MVKSHRLFLKNPKSSGRATFQKMNIPYKYSRNAVRGMSQFNPGLLLFCPRLPRSLHLHVKPKLPLTDFEVNLYFVISGDFYSVNQLCNYHFLYINGAFGNRPHSRD